MKATKITLGIFICMFVLLSSNAMAQKCLDISIVNLMSNLQAPSADGSVVFAACKTEKSDNGVTSIVDYGTYLTNLNALIEKTSKDFTNSSASSYTQTNLNAQELADKLKKMSDAERQQYAMQMAMQRSAAATTSLQDDAETSKLVYQTQELGHQLSTLNKEFLTKLGVINAQPEIDKIVKPNYSKCPAVDKVGMQSCECMNKLDAAYWQQAVTIMNTKNSQKVALLNSYLPRLKALAQSIDNNITKLQFGNAIKTPALKQALFSTQSSAFANAFDASAACINMVIKDGADTYVKKFNSDHNVYSLSCSK